MTGRTRDAWAVYSKACAVCVAIWLANFAIEHLVEARIHDRAICWATALAIFQASAVTLLSLYLLGVRGYTRVKERLHDQIRPAIRDRVLALAFDGESWPSAVPKSGLDRYVLEECIAQALISLKASGRDRVARFAIEQGFANEWVKAFSLGSTSARKRALFLLGLISPEAGNTVLPIALHDKQATVRIEACRALLISGDRLAIDDVFRSVLTESLLVRALLADDLKRHSPHLLADTIPALLETGTSLEIMRIFEMLNAWKRALPSFDIRPWLSGDPAHLSRPLILTLLPYVAIDNSIEDDLVSALKSADAEVQCAAADAAGRLGLERLIPALSSAMGHDRRLALASATAIARMGTPGERYLEKIVTGPDREAAAVAMEALEQATVRL